MSTLAMNPIEAQAITAHLLAGGSLHAAASARMQALHAQLASLRLLGLPGPLPVFPSPPPARAAAHAPVWPGATPLQGKHFSAPSVPFEAPEFQPPVRPAQSAHRGEQSSSSSVLGGFSVPQLCPAQRICAMCKKAICLDGQTGGTTA